MTNHPPLLYTTPVGLWKTILRELQCQVSKVTYDTWLVNSFVLTEYSTMSAITVVVRNIYAAQWLTNRLYPIVNRTAVAIAGQHIDICFIPNVMPNHEWYDNNRSPPTPMQLRFYEVQSPNRFF